MIRFAPLESTKPQLPQKVLRSLGGDELNVAVDLALLGVKCKWISVVPKGPLGQAVMSCQELSPLLEITGLCDVEGDLGIFTVLPEIKSVHYQRSSSAFARCANQLVWPTLLNAPSWFHVTGITPLVSDPSRLSWLAAVQHAKSQQIPISLDLNHRKQLGTLQELWTIVESVCEGLDLLILSVEQLHGLTKLLLGTSLADDEDEYMSVLSRLQAKTKFKRVALCRKIRYSTGVQRRWSLLVDAHTQNKSKPIYHIPKDECGGGSAWAAGMIYSLLEQLPITDALRRADLVAALCQTSAGDFSQRTGEDLRTLEASLASEKRNLTFEIWEDKTHETPSALPVMPVMPVGLSQSLPSISIETTLQKMKEAKVLAIFRVKGSAQVAIDRGMELASLGYKAMEITIDSPDWKTILSTLRQRLPADVVLGIGTVMDDTVSEIPLAKSLGATFALSPIDPIGLIEVCTSLGVLAVPSAFTSNECWSMHRRGARLIKLFHAGLASPAILKAMLEVTPLGENLNILPSGSVSPSNASEWLKAGAAVVGMGSNLVGKDVNLKPGTTEFQAAVDDWKDKGRPVVEKLIKELA